MKPLFTIHAGEYLVGSHIEQNIKCPVGPKVNDKSPPVNVWIPSRDTGVDLLVTDSTNTHVSTVQVKFSKDYLALMKRPEVKEHFDSCGWWVLKADKVRESKAAYWVFVIPAFFGSKNDYLVMTKQDVIDVIDQRANGTKAVNLYFWIKKKSKKGEQAECWETRGVKKHEITSLIKGKTQIEDHRNMSRFLNNWSLITSEWPVPSSEC